MSWLAGVPREVPDAGARPLHHAAGRGRADRQIIGEDGPQAQHVGVQRQGGRHGQLGQGVVPALEIVRSSCSKHSLLLRAEQGSFKKNLPKPLEEER